MRKISLTACALLLALPMVAVIAADQADIQLDYLAQNLDLTGDQRDAIGHILATDRQLALVDRNRLADQPDELSTAVDKRIADTDKEMQQKLSDEQKAKLAALGAGTELSRRTRMLAGRLGLDAVQVFRINELVRQAGPERPPREEGAQGTAQEDRSARMAQMREQMDKLNDQIGALLTPEQKTEYDRLRAENKERMQSHSGEHRGPGMGGGRRGHGGGSR